TWSPPAPPCARRWRPSPRPVAPWPRWRSASTARKPSPRAMAARRPRPWPATPASPSSPWPRSTTCLHWRAKMRNLWTSASACSHTGTATAFPEAMNLNRIAAAMLLLAVAATASAQQKGGKKLYCWEENGQRTCGDALPPGAVELARTEINAATGRATGEVGRALTDEEVAAAAAREKQAIADTLAAAAQRRRDMAMVESYATEQDLRNAYGERLALLDDALKASVMGEENLRRS